MTHEARSERTARILTARVEELARALEEARAPRDAAARLLASAALATLHAVTLDLITAPCAERIWSDVAMRHPQVEALREPLELPLAA
jgi:hypothetical protein